MGNHVWRSMRNAWAVALLRPFVSLPAMAASNPANMPVTATIVTLRAIPPSAAALYPNIQVRDYYGTGTNCSIQYAWSVSDSRSDNGGAIINPAPLGVPNPNPGRWNVNLPLNSPVHSCVFGVKVDSPAAAGTGTDNSTQMQALLDWAYNYGPNRVHLDSLQGNCIGIVSVLNPNQGEIIEGDGPGDQNQTVNTGSCLNYTGVAGSAGTYVLTTQSTLTGLGTTPFESPKFRDFAINYFSADTNPGGCIQLNSIAGGFTDDPTSQQPLVRPEFTNIWCSLRSINNSAKIGFQVSKARDGSFTNVSVFGGNTGIDLEGFENPHIVGGSVQDTFGPDIRLKRQGTFGQVNSVSNVQILSPFNFSQTVDALIYDDARESTIRDNFFEQLGGVTVNCYVHLGNGFNAGIYNNSWTGTTTNSLCVDGTFNNLQSQNNGGAGGGISPAKFLAGNYNYSNDVRSILTHSGNGPSGDSGWPFNSQIGLDEILPPNIEGIWAANYTGLSPNGYGLAEIPVNSNFTMPTTGTSSSNYLEFIINRLPAPTGTFDLQIHAWQTTGAGQWTCQLEDNGALVGSPIAQATTAAPQWYTLAFAQAVSTNAGARCWNTGTGTAPNPAMLGQINLVDH